MRNQDMEEMDHLATAMFFARCGEAFGAARRGEEIPADDHRRMIELSAFLLDALSWQWQSERRGMVDRYMFVDEVYGCTPRTEAEMQHQAEYWEFVDVMRRVALAIAFQRTPQCDPKTLERMATWCLGAHDIEMAEIPRGCCG